MIFLIRMLIMFLLDLFLGIWCFYVIIHGTLKKTFEIIIAYIEKFPWLSYIDILTGKLLNCYFLMTQCWNLSSAFSASICMIPFVFSTLNYQCGELLFFSLFNIKPNLYYWNKPDLSKMCIFFSFI